MPNTDLLSLLQHKHFMSDTIVHLLQNYMNRWHVAPYQALIDCHILSESEIANCIAQHFQIDRYYTIEETDIDKKTLSRVPYKVARQYQCLPIARERDAIKIIFVDPTNQDAIKKIQEWTQSNLILAVATKTDVDLAIGRYYSVEDQFESLGII